MIRTISYKHVMFLSKTVFTSGHTILKKKTKKNIKTMSMRSY